MADFEFFKENVTFIVKTFERRDCFGEQVRSLATHYPGCRLLVVDDSFNRYAEEELDGMDLEWRVLPCEDDIGLSKGRNMMADAVETKYLILLDDDYIMTSRSFLHVLEFKLKNTEYDVIGVGVMERGRRNILARNIHSEGRTLVETDAKNKHEKVDMVHNCFLAESRTIRRIRWDDRIKIAGEHIDFVIRAKEKGLKTINAPVCDVIHRRIHDKFYKRHRLRSHLSLVLDKHGFDAIRRFNGKLLRKRPGIRY